MGFLTDKLFNQNNHIIKTVLERWDIKQLILKLHRLDLEIHHKIPDEVKKRHNITSAEKHYQAAIKEFKGAEKNEHHLFRNVMLDEQELLDADEKGAIFFKKHIKRMENEEKLKELKEKLLHLEKKFKIAMWDIFKEAKNETQGEYKRVMQVISSAEGGQKTFMDGMTAFWKNESADFGQYWLAKLEVNDAIRHAERAKSEMARFEKMIENLEREIRKKNDPKEVSHKVQALEAELDKIVMNERESFKKDYHVVMRCFIMTFIMMKYLHEFEEYQVEVVQDKDMPEASLTKAEVKMLREDMLKISHYQAQALRVTFKDMERAATQV